MILTNVFELGIVYFKFPYKRRDVGEGYIIYGILLVYYVIFHAYIMEHYQCIMYSVLAQVLKSILNQFKYFK